MAVEIAILSFEGALPGEILLPSGQTVPQHIETGDMLAAPKRFK
ncbi:hypothetical protein [Dyadobacter chenhuakuii]|nr:hypothetical protein [Dyadobacter chenhuakuii]